MDDLEYGTRDKRGNWTPKNPLQIAPFWEGKWDQMKHFALEYFWPWNTFHMIVTLAYWFVLLEPNLEAFQAWNWTWVGILYAVNAGGIFLMYGSIELFYYVKRKQGTRFNKRVAPAL